MWNISTGNVFYSAHTHNRSKSDYSNESIKGSLSNRDGLRLTNMTVGGESSSSMGRVDAVDSHLKSVTGRDGVTLRNSSATDVRSSMGRVNADDCQLRSVQGRDAVTLTNSSADDVQSSMGRVHWDGQRCPTTENATVSGRDGVRLTNVRAHKATSSMGRVTVHGGTCKTLEGRDGVEGTSTTFGKATSSMGRAVVTQCQGGRAEGREGVVVTDHSTLNSAGSSMGRAVISDSTVEDVSARDGVQMTNSLGRKAESSMGTVTINCQGSTRGDFQFVSGRDGISLANAHVETATASMGTVRSRDCEVDSIECRDALDCQNSKLGTVTLTIDPDQGATLDLSGSTITGPVTIRAPQSITFSGGHISIGGSSFTSFGGDCVDTCINTGDSNVPDWTADLVDEGETAKINGHIVTKKNGILVPAKKSRDETSVMTTAQLIESIRPVANMICRTGRLNYQGGEYKIDHGRIQVLKAPPGVTLTDAPAGVTTAKLPSAAIRIIGGSIKGNVIFEGCTGSITLTKDANVLGDIVGGSIVND